MPEMVMVESIDHRDDGGTTIYGTTTTGEPAVLSFPPGAPIHVAVCNHCGTKLKFGQCPNEPHE